MRKLLLLILLLIPCLLLISACGDKPTQNTAPLAAAYYSAEYIPLPADSIVTMALCYEPTSSSICYLSFTEQGPAKLISANEQEIRQLEAYAIPAQLGGEAEAPTSYNFAGMAADNSNGLWLAFTYQPAQPADGSYVPTATRFLLQHVDGNGAELGLLELSDLLPELSFSAGSPFTVDGEGRIYIKDSKGKVQVLDSAGKLLFSLTPGGQLLQLECGGDGAVYALLSGPEGSSLCAVEAKKQSWGATTTLPTPASALYPGSAHSVLFIGGGDLYGLSSPDARVDNLLNWLNCNFVSNNIRFAAQLPDGRLLCLNQQDPADPNTSELAYLTRTDSASPPDKITLKLAMFMKNVSFEKAALEFNRTNQEYRIEIANYDVEALLDANPDFDTAINQAITAMNLDIISGNAPDMFVTAYLPVAQYGASGLFEDLYPYLDEDDELSRDDIIPNVLASWDMGGHLYNICGSFAISTAYAPAELANNLTSWTRDDFRALLAANPELGNPFATYQPLQLLNLLCGHELGSFVDWQAGSCDLDNPAFIELLEFCAEFGEGKPSTAFDSREDWEASYRQLLVSETISSFFDMQYCRNMAGQDIAFIGLPTTANTGSAITSWDGLAINSSSEHKDACWRFVRRFLTPQVGGVGLPVTRQAFADRLEEVQTVTMITNPDGSVEKKHNGATGASFNDGSSIHYTYYSITKEEAEQLQQLVDSTVKSAYKDNNVLDIIKEEAAVFFAGQISAAEAAKRIQSRVDIYINEQK